MLYIAGRPVHIRKSTLHGCHKKEHGSEMARYAERDQNTTSQQPDGDDLFGVTIKVAEPGYVPAGVKLRGHISANLLTATVTPEDMENLETDSRVISISAPRKLHSARNQ
ncbi:hypothetical protein [Rivularia sp. UHCC 0363]|uniref:hypothetical protein n=1 Tax=Rivularia sp. UHCC 0363 TaxID=3110244 RepID=UPI002B21D94E|nr:hypothetical protein [Rivularia sp. UHCC 0363]MEA5595410.1 hypothetical protein [Rivularia sp. UHCC 0363]